MFPETTLFREIRFVGGRFDKAAGWLDVSVLSEVKYYRDLVVDVACEKWRQEHPDRQRLPSGFRTRFSLGIAGEIGAGSCVVTTHRRPDEQELTHIPDHFDDAAQVIDDTLSAVIERRPFPRVMTIPILRKFENWGSALEEKESIILEAGEKRSPPFDSELREALLSRLPAGDPYTDGVNIRGEVRAVDLNAQTGGSFQIRLPNGDSIPGIFTDEQKASVIEALRDHSEARLSVTGKGEFEPSGKLERICQVDGVRIVRVGESLFDPAAPSILDIFDEIHRTVPNEAFDGLPDDGARNLKGYLYGSLTPETSMPIAWTNTGASPTAPVS